MMPTSINWPKDGEIDIMENLGHDMKRTYSTIHYGSSPAAHKSKGSSLSMPGNKTLDDGFHLYRVDWMNEMLIFTVDNLHVFTVRKDQIEKTEWWPFDAHEFFIILNLAVGGNWPGPPDNNTKFPAEMIVEYVKVYKQ